MLLSKWFLVTGHGHGEGVERHGDHGVEADRADELDHHLFAEQRHAALVACVGQRSGGVELYRDVVNQPFVVAGEIRRAALADGLDNLGRDTELERVGLVDEPGILRGGRNARRRESSTRASAVRGSRAKRTFLVT